MSLIPSKISERLRRIFQLPVPRSSHPPLPIALPPEASEVWYAAKDMMTVFPVGSVGRGRIVAVFMTHLKQKPSLIARLHPASSQFHHDLVYEIMRHPHLTEDLRGTMLGNPEITAALL